MNRRLVVALIFAAAILLALWLVPSLTMRSVAPQVMPVEADIRVLSPALAASASVNVAPAYMPVEPDIGSVGRPASGAAAPASAAASVPKNDWRV